MKLFFKYISENIRLYPQVRFTKNDEIVSPKFSYESFELTNLNQMRGV